MIVRWESVQVVCILRIYVYFVHNMYIHTDVGENEAVTWYIGTVTYIKTAHLSGKWGTCYLRADDSISGFTLPSFKISTYENFAGAGRDRWVTVNTCILEYE